MDCKFGLQFSRCTNRDVAPFRHLYVFVSPSSRYALLDTADLPLTIRETTVDYQVRCLMCPISISEHL